MMSCSYSLIEQQQPEQESAKEGRKAVEHRWRSSYGSLGLLMERNCLLSPDIFLPR